MNEPRKPPHVVAQQLWFERYPTASTLFCGGSVVRGEGFPSSDLDVVVVFEHVAHAWRESVCFQGWPVEVFAHDLETLAYFVAQDCKQGRPSLAHMICEGLVIPAETPSSQAIQAWARSVVATRPEPPSSEALAQERYCLTDLIDDLRDDRSPVELRAIGCKLYPLVCNFVLKARGYWQGSGKSLPRLLAAAAPEVSELVERTFEVFFTTGDRTDLLRAVQRILEPFGGELFDGFRSDASTSCRLSVAEIPALRDLLR